MESAIYNELIEKIPEENILVDEPMEKHTSFKIGGKADFLVTVKTIGQIKAILELVRRKNIKLTVKSIVSIPDENVTLKCKDVKDNYKVIQNSDKTELEDIYIIDKDLCEIYNG